MKDGTFQLRVSKEVKDALNKLAEHYNISASSVICMLISNDYRKVKNEKKNENIEFV